MHDGALSRPLKAVGLLLATLVALVFAAGAADAAPAAPPAESPAPPGPVRSLELHDRGGEGARTTYFDAGWAQPADIGDGVRLHYVYDVHDTVGDRVDAGTTSGTTAGRFGADRCTAPYTVTVHAVTVDPATGAPLAGPETSARLGKLSCEINSSLSASQTGPGTLQVDIKREAPVDPYVAGDCVLRDNGRAVWTGTCGGATDEQATLRGVAPGTHHLALTTTSPNGEDYAAETTTTVG
jgi:hypothetical protein